MSGTKALSSVTFQVPTMPTTTYLMWEIVLRPRSLVVAATPRKMEEARHEIVGLLHSAREEKNIAADSSQSIYLVALSISWRAGQGSEIAC